MKKIISLFVAVLLVVSCCAVLTACNRVANNTEHYDKITKTFKLTKDYEGKNFLTDGIGKATVDAYTDGDTTRFKLATGGTVIIRYYMINTPESTGQVQKWGKAASLFTKQQLSEATEIVLESSTGGAAEHDSYGSRWLGYVWYKTADSDFKCLNLELVENGYSANEGVHTDKYPYWSYFDEAEQFAKSIQLRMWSKLDDPLFTNDPVDMTIKDFWNNTDAYYDSETHNGAKVVFTAFITDLYVSRTGTYTFTATEYYPETGETYSINVYAAYSSSYSSQMKIGSMYRFIGTVQEYPEDSGNFQISGINLASELVDGGPGLTLLVQKAYYVTFNSSLIGEYINNYSHSFYGDLEVTSVSLNGTTLTIKGNAYQFYSKGNYEENATEFTITVEVPSDYKDAIQEGSVLSLVGLQMVEKSGNITVLDYKDIIIK